MIKLLKKNCQKKNRLKESKYYSDKFISDVGMKMSKEFDQLGGPDQVNNANDELDKELSGWMKINPATLEMILRNNFKSNFKGISGPHKMRQTAEHFYKKYFKNKK